MGVQAAFFIGPGSWADEVIRWRTSSDASHVELVINGFKFSSSPADGGVRRAEFQPDPAQWRMVDLPWASPEGVLAFFDKTRGDRYDWLAVCVGQALSAKVDVPGRWFCSEWCAAALGMSDPWRYSPALLEVALSDAVRLIPAAA